MADVDNKLALSGVAGELGDKGVRWAIDAVEFVKDMWGAETLRDEQQVSILRAVSHVGAERGLDGLLRKRVAVKSGHGTGKTAAEAMLTIRHLLVYNRAKVGITSPSGGQMEGAIKPEIRHWISEMPKFWNSQLKVTDDKVYAVETPSERFATFRLARRDQPEALQGLHAPHVLWIIEEATGVDDALWPFIEGSCTDPDTWILACANPTRSTGRFHKCFFADRDQWTRITLNSEKSSFGGAKLAASTLAAHGRDSDYYRVRILGEFPNESYDQLMAESLVDAGMDRKLTDADVAHAPTVLGCDTAWFGGDPCCVYLRQGLKAQFLGKWTSISTDRFAGIIARLEDEWEVDAIMVDCGGSGGGGVVDSLRRMGRKPIPAWFGSKALNEKEFLNRRVEMWWSIKEWLEVDGGALPKREDLKQDLCGPSYWYNASGKKQMESKDDMRSRGLHSPNEADALALTFYCPVLRRNNRRRQMRDELDEMIGGMKMRPPKQNQKQYEPMGGPCPFPMR